MKNLGNAAKGGRDAGLLLKEVIETISGRAPKPDFGKDDNWWWFGLKIPKDVCPKWQPLIKPRRKKSDLGWFGYEGEGDLINLSVWFYCGNQAISVKLLKRLKHKLARQSQRKIAIERQQDEKFPNYVRVSLPAKNSQGDKGWFMEVFEVLDDVRK